MATSPGIILSHTLPRDVSLSDFLINSSPFIHKKLVILDFITLLNQPCLRAQPSNIWLYLKGLRGRGVTTQLSTTVNADQEESKLEPSVEE